MYAARANSLETVKTLLAAGADINQTSGYGWTPLLVATQNRFYQLGSFLLDSGADPNKANNGGWTPLYLAVDNRNIEGGDYPARKGDMDHLEFIRKLIDKGADVNARIKDNTDKRTVFTNHVARRGWRHARSCARRSRRPRGHAAAARARRRSEDHDGGQRHGAAGGGGHRLGGGH